MFSRFFKILALVNAVTWALVAIITIGSNYYDLNIVNCIMGFVFFLIGFFLYKKYRNIENLVIEFKKIEISNPSFLIALKKTLNLELIPIIISLLVALVAISWVASRVFLEKFSVFG